MRDDRGKIHLSPRVHLLGLPNCWHYVYESENALHITIFVSEAFLFLIIKKTDDKEKH